MLISSPERINAEAPAEGAEGFRELAEEQLPRLYAIARRLVGEDAEDAVQDCLLKAFKRFSQLEDREAGPAWLAKTLVNCCRDRARAESRRPKQIDFDEVEDFSLFRKVAHEDPFPYSDRLHLDFLGSFGPEEVRQVLTGLPELYRTPLVLVYMYEFSTKEVAEMVEAPRGTILARLHRGRKLFERRMWDYAEGSGLLAEEGKRS